MMFFNWLPLPLSFQANGIGFKSVEKVLLFQICRFVLFHYYTRRKKKLPWLHKLNSCFFFLGPHVCIYVSPATLRFGNGRTVQSRISKTYKLAAGMQMKRVSVPHLRRAIHRVKRMTKKIYISWIKYNKDFGDKHVKLVEIFEEQKWNRFRTLR